jgi:hypothetical protein
VREPRGSIIASALRFANRRRDAIIARRYDALKSSRGPLMIRAALLAALLYAPLPAIAEEMTPSEQSAYDDGVAACIAYKELWGGSEWTHVPYYWTPGESPSRGPAFERGSRWAGCKGIDVLRDPKKR